MDQHRALNVDLNCCLDRFHEYGYSNFIACIEDTSNVVYGHCVLDQSGKPIFRSEDCENQNLDPESLDWRVW